MRHTMFAAVALFLAAVPAFAQQTAGRATATPQRAQRRESDSTFIAREWAAWDALKNADSAAFVRAVGQSPSLLFVSANGILRTSSAEMGRDVTKCDTRSHKLDMFTVAHPTEETAIVTYRVTLDRRCGRATRTSGIIALQQIAMTVWARRHDRWEAVAQSVTALSNR